MTKKAPSPRRRRVPPNESAVYAGRDLLGAILPRGAGFLARTAVGRSLGSFKTEKAAMHALCEAGRLASEGELNPRGSRKRPNARAQT